MILKGKTVGFSMEGFHRHRKDQGDGQIHKTHVFSRQDPVPQFPQVLAFTRVVKKKNAISDKVQRKYDIRGGSFVFFPVSFCGRSE